MRSNRLAAALLVVLLVTPSLAMTLGTTSLTVETNRAKYEPGDEVRIRGTAEADLNVTIDLIYDSTILFHFNITAKKDGNYSDEITLPDDEYGEFTVNATQEGVTVQTTFTVVDMSDKDLAHELLREAEKLMGQVEDAFDELGENEVEVPPEAEENFTLGIEALTLAQADFEDGNYSDAAEEARLALGYFGDAFKPVQEVALEVADESKVRVLEDEDDDEDEVDSTYGLIVAIDRTLEYIEKVKVTAEKLEAEGYEIDEALLVELDDNTTALNKLREQLLKHEINNPDAAKSLAEIRGNIGRIMGMLHSTTLKAYKLEMAERFMEQVQSQIRGIEEKISRLGVRLEAEKVFSVGNSLGAIYRRVERLRERMGTDDLEGVLIELRGLMNEIDDNLNELNGEGISANLREMNSIEARIRVLNATAERLRRKGEDTYDIDIQLQEAVGLLETMMEQLEKGENEAAQDLLDEVKRKYEELRENVESPFINQIKEKFIEQIQKRILDYTDNNSLKPTP